MELVIRNCTGDCDSDETDSTSSTPSIHNLELHVLVIKIHVVCMIFAWILLIPTSNYVARHFRAVYAEKSFCKLKKWTLIHIVLATLATVLAAIGFIVLLWGPHGYPGPRLLLHSFVSIASMAAGFFSFVHGFFAPKSSRTSGAKNVGALWSWTHFSTGNGAMIMAVPSMLSGLGQTQAFPLKFIFPTAVPIIHLLMNEIIAKHKVIQHRINKSQEQPRSRKPSDSGKASESRKVSGTLGNPEETKALTGSQIAVSLPAPPPPGTMNAPERRFRKLALLVYVVLQGTVAVTFAISFCLAWPL